MVSMMTQGLGGLRFDAGRELIGAASQNRSEELTNAAGHIRDLLDEQPPELRVAGAARNRTDKNARDCS